MFPILVTAFARARQRRHGSRFDDDLADQVVFGIGDQSEFAKSVALSTTLKVQCEYTVAYPAPTCRISLSLKSRARVITLWRLGTFECGLCLSCSRLGPMGLWG